ncbi:hypothetical protein FHS31_002659 [Sphingomonas vulcanisoli]|uniref:Transcriptional regulator n=1 Tax=Sphingomonas vulcanisoli TaxID=1658060 RepID=A0ABX0TWF5_9SPHN|nr:hypothetical protein [Sphingomonas vulcanisoli]NIJ09029.1 hypothetical protein [Sphingomonas vulcanisoli]
MSKTSAESEEAVIDMAELGASLARRRATLAPVETPRNAGKARTASKRALLRAIEEAGGHW